MSKLTKRNVLKAIKSTPGGIVIPEGINNYGMVLINKADIENTERASNGQTD
jgi:hypothetical protein